MTCEFVIYYCYYFVYRKRQAAQLKGSPPAKKGRMAEKVCKDITASKCFYKLHAGLFVLVLAY